VFNLPQRNRSVVDFTNYCMDFVPKRVMQYRYFEWMTCRERQQRWVLAEPICNDMII